MNVVRFYYLLRVLFNDRLSVDTVHDEDWKWLLESGYITPVGSTSFGLTNEAKAFVMDRFSKILAL